MTRIAVVVVSAALLVGAAGCSKKKGSGWLVGEHGLMVRIDDGEAERYPTGVESDLLAIACRGDSEAWAVGADGVVLRTEDGGSSWLPLETGTEATLRAVATSSGDAVWLAGDDGTVVHSPEPGVFDVVDLGEAHLTSIATDASGRFAIVGSTEGWITRVEDGSVVASVAIGVPIRSVAITPAGGTVVAVGDEGTVVWTDERLETWTTRETGATESLHAVRIASDGSLAMAVGDDGTIVRITDGSTDVDHVGGASLLALHFQADHHAMAVGASGTVLFSEDLGATWTSIDAGTNATFFGVDDLHGEPHL